MARKVRCVIWDAGIALVGSWPKDGFRRVARPFLKTFHDRFKGAQGAGPGGTIYPKPVAASVITEEMRGRRPRTNVVVFRVGPRASQSRLAALAKDIVADYPRAKGRLFVLGHQPELETAGCRRLHGDMSRAGRALLGQLTDRLKVYYARA